VRARARHRQPFMRVRVAQWSMGVILYMLVSGVPPFWGRSDKEIRLRILRGSVSVSARHTDWTRTITACGAWQHLHLS
jgi:hypothetical protein